MRHFLCRQWMMIGRRRLGCRCASCRCVVGLQCIRHSYCRELDFSLARPFAPGSESSTCGTFAHTLTRFSLRMPKIPTSTFRRLCVLGIGLQLGCSPTSSTCLTYGRLRPWCRRQLFPVVQCLEVRRRAVHHGACTCSSWLSQVLKT